MPEAGSRTGRGWLRAVGLLTGTVLFSVLNPGVLVALPFVLLALFVPSRSPVTLLVALFATFLAMGGRPTDGLWYLERGWGLVLGGCFLALTLRWPGLRFMPRGLGAVAGAFLVTGGVFLVRPGDWLVVRWMITSRMEAGLGAALGALQALQGREGFTEAFENSAVQAMAVQGSVFPALLGLASLSALGLGWWLFVRLTNGSGDGVGPLREFRFHDHLIWILILGLLGLVGTSGALEGLGTNAVVFMGALYALRGSAVVLFMTKGVSFLGALLLSVGFLLVAPLMLTAAFVIGVGDTWLNFRARLGSVGSR
ncbi:DUF2232 domain-containing protein [Gemmatimonadota bacterium]